MPRYRGAIESHTAIKSATKGTPGIKFIITLREVLRGMKWEDIQWKEVDATIYFAPGSDPKWNLKKLAFAGYTGGGLSSMNLVGNAVEVESSYETYNGKQRERYDLALPPNEDGPSDEAFLAIDAILQSSQVPTVGKASFDDNAPRAGSGSGSGSSTPAGSTGPEPTPSQWNDEEDVPF